MEVDIKASRRLDELGAISDDPPRLTRTFLSRALCQAKQLVAGWMAEAGLQVYEDQAGNLIGRLDCGLPNAHTVVCGSHLDTVRDAGKFDGALGVIAGIQAAERLPKLPYNLEIVAFSDEEGVRFQTTYLGSRHYTGRLGDEELACRDEKGVSVRDAIAHHRPTLPPPPSRGPLLGYVEVHIEQGPVLENGGLALGVATAIAGQTRARMFWEGKAGHAGTTPMNMRHDALTGAAECILLIEKRAAACAGLVATVGELRILSAASNVIPGRVECTLDLRGANDSERAEFCQTLFSEMEAQMEKRRLGFRFEILLRTPSVVCSPVLTTTLAGKVFERQGSCPELVSGAGHDAVALAEVTDVAMLMVRCRDGLSHHPDEFASSADIELAIAVLTDFLAAFPLP